MPVFSSYVKRDGSVEPAYDLSKWSAQEAGSTLSTGAQGYKEFVLKIRKEQPMLYNTLISEEKPDTALTNNGIKNQQTLEAYIQKNTHNLIGNGAQPIALLDEGTPITKKGIFNKSK